MSKKPLPKDLKAGIPYTPTGTTQYTSRVEVICLSPKPAKCLPNTDRAGSASSCPSQVNEAVARFPAQRNLASDYAMERRWYFGAFVFWLGLGILLCMVTSYLMWQAFVIPALILFAYPLMGKKDQKEQRQGRWVFFHRQRREVAFTVPTTRSKTGPLRVEYCPWEEVVAFVTSTEASAESKKLNERFSKRSAETLRNIFLYVCMPNPDDKEKIKYSIVHGWSWKETAKKKGIGYGIMGWNATRAFMECEPFGIEDRSDWSMMTQKDEFGDLKTVPSILDERTLTYEYYLENIKGKTSPNPHYDPGYPDFTEQGYKIQDKNLKKMNARLPDSFWEWAKPIPESEWKKPSKELAELNARLDTGFAEGKTFEEQMHEILKEQGQEPVRDFRKDKSVPITPIQPKSDQNGVVL